MFQLRACFGICTLSVTKCHLVIKGVFSTRECVCEHVVSGCLLSQLVEGAESVGSWPALSEVAQKARKEAEKENKPQCGGGGSGGDGGGGGGGEEGEGGGKVTVVMEAPPG